MGHRRAAGAEPSALHAAITDRSPVGLPGKLTVTGEDGKARATVDLKPEDARYLQKSANDAVKREKTGSGK